MDFEIKIMTPAERSYCYTGSQQLDKQTGCIGHLRGDMDRSGNGFFTSWEDHCGELKTQAFKDEFDDFINALRFDERYDGIFKNRSSLSRYCYEHKVCLPRILFRSTDSGWIRRSMPICCG